MYDESLSNDITEYIFADENMYRKHFVPCKSHMQKNPQDHDRVMELVDNAVYNFVKTTNIPMSKITPETKKELAINVYQEMINDVLTGKSQK
jgi:uncharacterized protein YaaW (UPF0174 family)|tara:strand:+ start:3999 stop:4274 length:276 start_codon:yes stop_codon:yes gene_type:complete